MNKQANTQALRPSAGGMVYLNLADQVALLKAKPEWSVHDRLSSSLVKDDALNVLLIILKKGARLSEHRTKGPIAIQVLSGTVGFFAGGDQVTLSAAGLVALDRNIIHSLEALEESAVLLTTALD